MDALAPLGTALIAALTLASAAHAEDAPLDALVHGAIAFHDDVSDHTLAELGSKQIEALLDGETVIVRRRARGEAGDVLEWVYAYALQARPRRHLWLAATRPGFSDSDAMTSVGLERHDDGRTLTFMHLDLPWPLDDRWWLAEVAMDVELAEASGGRIWARRWRLAEGAEGRAHSLAGAGELGPFDRATLDAGLALPINEGAFLVFDLDGTHTLIAYASLISAGGSVPDGFFADFASRTLRRNIERIIDEADDVPSRYVGDAALCADGFGRPLPHFSHGAPPAASKNTASH